MRRGIKLNSRICLALVLAGIASIALLAAASCIDVSPKLYASITPNPTPTPSPTPKQTELPTEPPQPSNTPVTDSKIDAMGNTIIGADHYTRYITFTDIFVYEENGDTFVDCIAGNEYAAPLVCAVDIVFFDDDGVEIARARLQTRDAKYLLTLQRGETVLFAHVLTDTTLLDCDFVLEYNSETSVHPG